MRAFSKVSAETIKDRLRASQNDIIKFLIYLCSIFLTYMLFTYKYITHDSCVIPESIYRGLEWDIATYVSGGRPFHLIFQFVNYFFHKLGINYYDESILYIQYLGMILYAFDAMIFYKILNLAKNQPKEDNKYQTESILKDVIVLIPFINPFVVETYTYGAFDWAVQALLSLLAAYYLLDNKYFRGVLFAICAYTMYQSDIFIVLVVCYGCTIDRYLYNKKKLVKHLFLYGFICIAVAGGFLGLQKLSADFMNIHTVKSIETFGNASENLAASISDNGIVKGSRLGDIFQGIWLVCKYSYGMLPSYFLVVLFCIPNLFVSIISIYRKEYWNGIICFVISTLLMLIPFSTALVTSDNYFFPRTLLALFFAIAVLLQLTSNTVLTMKGLQYVYYATVVMCFMILLFYTKIVITDCYISRAIDEKEIIAIENEISRYEHTEGVEIVNIACQYDNNKRVYYDETLLDYNLSNAIPDRMVREPWSDIKYMTLVTGRKFESARHLTAEEYSSIFEDKEWNYYCPEEQLVFDGDTVYWAIY